ncbi:MAG: metal ABC transporter permease [Nocardiaceae bacterium]|nr:metal ABC transporter permease [Nocardiaceae bacterium]
MFTDIIGPHAGANIINSLVQAFQQGATIGTALGNFGGLLVTLGVNVWGSTFNNLGPDVVPLVFP